MAAWFGPALLRITAVPGTRLLNSAIRPDEKTLEYLQREFGREILKKSPWKVLPRNKKLMLPELVCLFRYHYWRTWDKAYSKDPYGCSKWPQQRLLHSRLLRDFRSMLVRYGFHGYGNPEDDNGIVVLAEDRLVLKEVVAHFDDSVEDLTMLKDDFRRFRDISEVRRYFRHDGSPRAMALAEQVAAADTDKPCR